MSAPSPRYRYGDPVELISRLVVVVLLAFGMGVGVGLLLARLLP
jgi:hypothetical protein